MFRSQIKLLIVFLFASFLMSFNDQAFHKENRLLEGKSIPWDKDNEAKKSAIDSSKKKFCAAEAKSQSKKTFETKDDGTRTELELPLKNVIQIRG